MSRLLFILSFLGVTLLVVNPSKASAAQIDRCQKYVQDVRKYHYEVFGIDYPYWYGVGQLKQESLCRDIISNDGVGSQGVSQITYKLWASYLKKFNIQDLKSTSNQIKAQAYIMKSCEQQAIAPNLWIMYQIYNGGSLVNTEIKRAGGADHDKAKLQCHRKVVHFTNGMTLDACEINYDYSKKIYKYGNQYILNTNSMKVVPIKYW